VNSFEATIGVPRKLLYKIIDEPPKVAAYRKELSKRRDLTEKLTPS